MPGLGYTGETEVIGFTEVMGLDGSAVDMVGEVRRKEGREGREGEGERRRCGRWSLSQSGVPGRELLTNVSTDGPGLERECVDPGGPPRGGNSRLTRGKSEGESGVGDGDGDGDEDEEMEMDEGGQEQDGC